MPATLIVLAHPEPQSFNGAWARATREASEALGHTVHWTDLCASRFDAVEAARHYRRGADAGRFDPLKAQEDASRSGTLPPDVVCEIERLRAADRVILHFPLWWFAPPAVLKGYFDRVFAHGATHKVDKRFGTGLFRGKSALMCVTTGASEAESAHNGREGNVQLLLWPVAHTLRYLGFDVLKPHVVHGVHGYHDGADARALDRRLTRILARHRDTIAGYEDLPRLKFNTDDQFDTQGRLRPGAPVHSPFVRHDP